MIARPLPGGRFGQKIERRKIVGRRRQQPYDEEIAGWNNAKTVKE